jgi:hypothetical protein
MSALAHADLSGLLRGELDNQGVTVAGAHVRACPACRDDLVEVAVGHALLVRSSQVLEPELSDAPDGGASFAGLVARLPERRRPGVTLRLLVAAAALVGAAGVGALAQAWLSGEDATRPDRSSSLLAVSGSGGGTVAMSESNGRTSMTISTHDLPVASSGQFYYAWLLDPSTNKMLPLGQVGPSGTASFEVSDALLAEYSAVDVSLEDDDGDPQHSPTSVLRATYA